MRGRSRHSRQEVDDAGKEIVVHCDWNAERKRRAGQQEGRKEVRGRCLEGKTSQQGRDLSQCQQAPGRAHGTKEKNIPRYSINRQTWSGESAKQWLHHVPSPSPVRTEGGRKVLRYGCETDRNQLSFETKKKQSRPSSLVSVGGLTDRNDERF